MRTAHGMMPAFGMGGDDAAAKAMRRRAKKALHSMLGSDDAWNETFIRSRMSSPTFLTDLKNAGGTPDVAATLAGMGIDPESDIGMKITDQQEKVTAYKNEVERAKIEAQAQQQQAAVDSANADSLYGLVGSVGQVAMAMLEAPFEQGTNVVKAAVNAADGGDEPLPSLADILSTDTTIGMMAQGAMGYYQGDGLDSNFLDWGDGFVIDPEAHASKIKAEFDRQVLGTQYMAGVKQARQVMGEDGKVQNITEVIPPPSTLGQYAANTYLHGNRGSDAYNAISGLIDLGTRAFDPSMYVGAAEFNAAFKGLNNALHAVSGGRFTRYVTQGDEAIAIAKGKVAIKADDIGSKLDDATARAGETATDVAEADARFADVVSRRPETEPFDQAIVAGQAKRSMSFAEAYLGRTRTVEDAANRAQSEWEATEAQVARDVNDTKRVADDYKYTVHEDHHKHNPFQIEPLKQIESGSRSFDPQEAAAANPRITDPDVVWVNGKSPRMTDQNRSIGKSVDEIRSVNEDVDAGGFPRPITVFLDRENNLYQVADEDVILASLGAESGVPVRVVEKELATIAHSAGTDDVREFTALGFTGRDSNEDIVSEIFGSPPEVRRSTIPPVAEVDTRGLNIQYHGAGNTIDDLVEGGEKSRNRNGTDNLVGPGLYTTDSFATASSYGKASPNAVVYQIEEAIPVKFFDLEKRVPRAASPEEEALGIAPETGPISDTEQGLLDLFQSAANRVAKAELADEVPDGADSVLAETWERVKYRRERGDATWIDVIDEIPWDNLPREISGRESAFTAIREYLEGKGYGGFTHKGGQHMGGDDHLVKVYWNPAKQVRIHKVDPKSPHDPAGLVARGKGAGQTYEEITTKIDGFDVPEVVGRGVADEAWTAEKAKAAEPVRVVETADGADVIHASGKVIAKRSTLKEAEALAEKLNKMPGYARKRTAAQVEPWDKVEARTGKEPLQIESGSSSYEDSFREGLKYDEVAGGLDDKRRWAAAQRAAAAKRAAEAEGKRQKAEQEARALSDLLGDQFGGRTTDTPEGVRDHLRRAAGLVGDTIDIDHGIAYALHSEDVGDIMRGLANVDSPALIYRLQPDIPAHLAEDLAAATSEDAVRKAFATAMARGDLSRDTGKLTGLRLAARAGLGADPEAKITKYADAFGHPGKIKRTMWRKVARYGATPWAAARHIGDRDGMVDLTYNMISYVFNMKWPKGLRVGGKNFGAVDEITYKVGDKEITTTADDFMDKHLNRMIAATDSMERRDAYYDTLTELTQIAGRQAGLDEAELKQFSSMLKASIYKQNNASDYLAEVLAASPDGRIVIDGEVLDGSNAALLEKELSDRVMSPDWNELRRVMGSVREAKKLNKSGEPGALETGQELFTDLFERYWRMSVIAFRGSYIIRNMGDIQVRMFLHNHPSMFTSPWGIAALAFSHIAPESRLGKAFQKMNEGIGKAMEPLARGNARLDGESLFADLTDDAGDLIVDEARFRQELFMDRMSHFDPGAAAPVGRRVGFHVKEAGQDGFLKGWSFELSKLQGSPIAVNVLSIMRGKVPKRVKAIMAAKNLSVEDAYVHYLVRGQGRPYLEKVLAGGRDIRKVAGDPANGDIELARKLKRYLFSEEVGDEYSLASRWRRHTLDMNEEFLAHVDEGFKKTNIHSKADSIKYGRKTERLIEKIARSDERYLDDAGELAWDRLPVQKVDAPIDDRVGNDVLHRATEIIDHGFDNFFAVSGRAEVAWGYGPEFRYSKWDRAAQLAGVLNADDAAKLVANARKNLGGLPNGWAKRTLKQIERNAKGKGDGTFTLKDLDYVTDKYGANVVKDLFYNAMRRNQWAHALRLVFPFIQPWANSIRIWSREAAKHTNRVYAAGVAYSAALGKDSNWMMDDQWNPNDAFFFRHPSNGQVMVGVPLLAQGMALVGDIFASARGGPKIDPSMLSSGISLQSMNLIFQGGIAPGVGPFVQIPAGVLEETDWYRSHVPEQVKSIIRPYVNTDPDTDPGILGAVTPAWVAGLAGALGFPDFSEKVRKYWQPAMAYLSNANPDGKYWTLGPNGEVQATTDQQRMLAQDAEALASTLLFGRSIFQNVTPGAPVMDVLIKGTDGKAYSQMIITQEYFDALNETGDRGQALATVADKYGPEVLFTLIPKREGQYTPTGDAWDFVKGNPRKAEKYGSVLGLIFPNGGYSAQFARWQNAAAGSPGLEPDQMAPWVSLLHRDAQLGRLDSKLAAGTISEEEYDARTKAIKDGYKGVPTPDSNYTGNEPDLAQIAAAAADPDVQAKAPQMTKDILMYDGLRKQAYEKAKAFGYTTLDSEACAPIREWLYDQALEIVKRNPNFIIPWKRLYKSEVDK